MVILERRHHPRQEAQIAVVVQTDGEKIPATLIDMSQGGVSVICERELPPGAEVKITVVLVDDYYFQGTVKWVLPAEKQDDREMYRIGIAAERVIV